MNRVRDEQGYAALVAIMVVLVLTIIGTNLLQTVMSSFTLLRKTEARGEAEYYARMGMDEAMARLQKVVSVVNAQGKTSMVEIQKAFDDQFATLFGTDADHTVSNSTSFNQKKAFDGIEWTTTGESVKLSSGGVDASYQIYFLKELKQNGKDAAPNAPLDVPFVQKITFRVIGKSHSPREESRALEAVVYVNTYPDEMQFVLSSSQNIILNGASLIEGDTYSNESYLVRKVAMAEQEVSYNGTKSKKIESAYPSIVGQLGMEGTDRIYRDDPATQITDTSTLQTAFPITPFVSVYKKNRPRFNAVEDISGTVGSKITSIPAVIGEPKTIIPDSDFFTPARLSGTFTSNVSVEDSHTVMKENDSAIIAGDLLTKGKFEMLDRTTSIRTEGNFYIQGVSDGTTSAYFRGDVAVPNDKYIVINGDAVFENLHLDGTVFIKGNLTIQGQFTIDGTIYVTDDVKITQDQDTSQIRNIDWEITESNHIKASFESGNPSSNVNAEFAVGKLEKGLFIENSKESICSSPCVSSAQVTGSTVVRLTISETKSDGTLLGREIYYFSESGLIDQTMVVLTRGEVAAYNLNENKESPKEIRAFIYSQVEPLNLYGICSHVQFIGGVYSKSTVTLNAARSENESSNTSLTCSGPDALGTYSITQSEVPTDPLTARLRLRYDYGLFESPPPGLPTSRTLRLKITQYELDTFATE